MSLPRRGAVCALALALVGTPIVAPMATAAPAPSPTPSATPAYPIPPGPPPTSTVGGADLLKPGVLVSRPAGVPRPPDLAAGAWLIADADDGRVVAARGAHIRSRPASTLKTLTGLVLAGKLDPKQIVTATPEDAAVDGTKVGLVPGEGYSVEQLLLGMMMTSGNDAANALARTNGGMSATATEMTAKARSLGALDTQAKNTSGLDADGQLTSAYDLALLGRAAIADPDLAPYLTVKTANIPGARTAGPKSKRGTYQISSHNRLLWNYEGTIGVKNGFTKAAGQTYIGAVRRGKQTYVITYLAGTSVNWHDTVSALDWAFAYGDKVRPVGHLVTAQEAAEPETTSAAGPPPEAQESTAGPALPATAQNVLNLGGAGLLAGGAAAVAAAVAVGALATRALRRRR